MSREDNVKKRALMLASVASMLDLFNNDNIDILLKKGYEVDAAANFDSGSITSQERVDKYRQELSSKGVRVYHIPIPRNLSRTGEMLNSYWMIRNMVNEKQYDLIHCHSPIGGVLCRLACRKVRKYGTKVIYTAHGFHFFKGAGRKAWLFYYPAEWLCANFTDVLITINKEDYRAAKKLPARRCVYVPGIGISVNEIKNIRTDRKVKRAEFGFKPADFIFMSTGQVSVRKNHEVVIKALAQIRDNRIKYLIVGFGELEEELKNLAEKLGVGERVRFAGYRQDVKELLHAADAFVFPSIQEGLPVALMEAMAAGLPVICSRIRGNTDLVEDGIGGWLADYDDVEGFARAMKKASYSYTEEMQLANQEKIKKFDKKIVNKKMEMIYRMESEHEKNTKNRDA